MDKDLYRAVGLDPDAPKRELIKAYRQGMVGQRRPSSGLQASYPTVDLEEAALALDSDLTLALHQAAIKSGLPESTAKGLNVKTSTRIEQTQHEFPQQLARIIITLAEDPRHTKFLQKSDGAKFMEGIKEAVQRHNRIHPQAQIEAGMQHKKHNYVCSLYGESRTLPQLVEPVNFFLRSYGVKPVFVDPKLIRYEQWSTGQDLG